MIAIGSILLMLPAASYESSGTTAIGAIFTATSAVCVTGLAVYDTATHWTAFGQAVILVLIQIGGMGVVTVAVLLAILSGKKIGLMQRNTMKEAISAPKVGGIVRMAAFILKVVIGIELLGAAALATVFVREFGIIKGLWYALFHSVSAFCNAGFDLSGIRAPFSSLMYYRDDPIVNITIMLLIISGGIGFLTWEDIRSKGIKLRRYSMQSKVILAMTLLLITLPSLYFYFFEFAEEPFKERVLSSVFQAVTPRTAGFNTADLNGLSDAGKLVVMILILIGGAPGSTAGGMKITTLAVLAAVSVSVFKRIDQACLFRRKIPDEAVRNAVAVLFIYLCLTLLGGMLICRIENIPLMTAMFETSSAIGTVGLSLGITPELGAVSKSILIGLMFFGRVGGLTLIFAAFTPKKPAGMSYPKEKITVG